MSSPGRRHALSNTDRCSSSPQVGKSSFHRITGQETPSTHRLFTCPSLAGSSPRKAAVCLFYSVEPLKPVPTNYHRPQTFQRMHDVRFSNRGRLYSGPHATTTPSGRSTRKTKSPKLTCASTNGSDDGQTTGGTDRKVVRSTAFPTRLFACPFQTKNTPNFSLRKTGAMGPDAHRQTHRRNWH